MKYCIHIVFQILLIHAAHSAAAEPVDTNHNTIIIKNSDRETVTITSQPEQAEVEQVIEALDKIPDDSQANLFVSTDDERVAEQVMHWWQKNPKKPKPKFVFMGKLLKKLKDNRVVRAAKKVHNHVISSIREDKIGFFILVASMTYDSTIWLHAEQYTLTQRASIIAMNLAMAVAFNVNKDSWTKIAGWLEDKSLNFLAKYGLIKLNSDRNSPQRFFSRLSTNLIMSTMIQAARFVILSPASFVDALLSADTWAKAATIGSLTGLSSFGWAESAANIEDKEHPVAKNSVRRLREIRDIATGYLAPSSKLLQPEVYGFNPVAFLLTHAAAGFIVLANSEEVRDWLEQHKHLNFYHEYYRKFDQILDRILFRNIKFSRRAEPISLDCKDALKPDE